MRSPIGQTRWIFLLGLQGFSGLEIPFDDCKCEKCDDVIVYVYVYINKYAIAESDFPSFKKHFMESNANIFCATNFWCNFGSTHTVDFHALRKECDSGYDQWVYVNQYYSTRKGREWLPRVLDRRSYFPNKNQVISGKCYKKQGNGR